MKVSAEITVSLKIPEVEKATTEAARLGLRDTIVAIHGDTIKNAQSIGFWETGHNARSIASEVSGMGTVLKGDDAQPEKVVNDAKLEAACYSTSGYGGYGEVGHHTRSGSWVNARPYFRPSLDRHKDELAPNIKSHLENTK